MKVFLLYDTHGLAGSANTARFPDQRRHRACGGFLGKIAVYGNGADFRDFRTEHSPKRGKFRSAKILIGTRRVSRDIEVQRLQKLKKCLFTPLPKSDFNHHLPRFFFTSIQPTNKATISCTS
jgi:hypothetical protein